MFGSRTVDDDDDADHHLLGQGDNNITELPHGMAWEQSSSTSEQNTSNPSELWEQDPLPGESYKLQETRAVESRPITRPRVQPEVQGEAATELEEEFVKIFSPVRLMNP